MNGIYYLNEGISLNGLSKEESLTLQKQSILNHVLNHHIQLLKLNPYQLNDYYTIPHALLYDLKKGQTQLDCLVIYSNQVLEDFIYTYPARWLILKSYFKQVITVEGHAEQTIQRVG